MPKDHLDALLANPTEILLKIRTEFGYANCPLTAEAVAIYLETGKVTKAKRLLPGQVVVQCSNSIKASMKEVKKALSRHGKHGVITKDAGQVNREHSANVVNIRGTIYLVDAYTKPGVFTAGFEKDWPTRVEFSRQWRMRVVPQEAVNEKTCD